MSYISMCLVYSIDFVRFCDTQSSLFLFSFFPFTYTTATVIFTLSLHDALPIFSAGVALGPLLSGLLLEVFGWEATRSEEHTSELQSRGHLVCRLLLEKKNRLVISKDTSLLFSVKQ